MRRIHVRLCFLVFATVTSSCSADSVAVGTNLAPCAISNGCPNGSSTTTLILPGQFLAQTFQLSGTTTVSEIYFVIGAVGQIPGNPDGSAPSSYSSLSFQMQLTDAIGSGSTAFDVLTTSTYQMPVAGPSE